MSDSKALAVVPAKIKDLKQQNASPDEIAASVKEGSEIQDIVSLTAKTVVFE